MTEIIENITEGIIETSLIEWLAVLTGVAYVILAARKSIFCWIFAIISAGLYVYICYTADLLIESFLQLFYVLMGIFGWIMWNNKKAEQYPIVTWRKDFHFLNIAVSTVIFLIVGYYFELNTSQDYPYLDAFTTVFSLAATYMVMQRVLENWLYWIVIDIAGMFLYAGKGFYLSAVLYLLFTILALIGFIKWRKTFKLQLR